MSEFQRIILPQPTQAEIDHLLYQMPELGRVGAILAIQKNLRTKKEVEAWFNLYDMPLHDPFLLKGMRPAVDRILSAIDAGEKVLVYGDYDVDGTTSVAVLYNYLSHFFMPGDIEYYIPDRYGEGYGLSAKGIQYAESKGFHLIITLDCGITAKKLVETATEKGIDCIIVDHHNVDLKSVPDCIAVIDPKQPDCHYPYKDLSACGLAYKLVQALNSEIEHYDDRDIMLYLRWVVCSIACDIVPMNGENRALAFKGLDMISKGAGYGLEALLRSTGKFEGNEFGGFNITISDIVYNIGPRINASGRMADAKESVRLLLAKSAEEAKGICQLIDSMNADRKLQDKITTSEALSQISEDPELQNSYTTVVANKGWSKGIVGIVASRCIENFYRPTIVFSEVDGKMVGSARSVEGISIYDALSECKELVYNFGGHSHAAGVTILPEKFSEFKKKFEEVVKSKAIKIGKPKPILNIDAIVKADELSTELVNLIEKFGPFGPGNMQPTFLIPETQSAEEPKMLINKETNEYKHLKLSVAQANGKLCKAIAFGMADRYEMVQQGKRFDIAFHLDLNTFRNQTDIQLRVKDITEPMPLTL